MPAELVDLNTATAEQLDTLPGVGPATAEAILSYRTEHGPFTSVDELLDVRGIGDAKLAELRDRRRSSSAWVWSWWRSRCGDRGSCSSG